MKDRLKYKVWDKEAGEFLKDDEYVLSMNEYGYDLHVFECNVYDEGSDMIVNTTPKELFEIIQSIGLKDKNGKLMFEKDKAKTPRGIGTIEYSEGRYIIEYGEETVDELFYFHADAYNLIEIIGNEFENPELINNTVNNNE